MVRFPPKRNTPKRVPLAAPPGTLPGPTALTLHLSSKILRKESRSTTEENIMNTFQLSLVVSYSDADASSPEFTVTDSIYIEQKGRYSETSAGSSDH
jgi:hypothetical protein